MHPTSSHIVVADISFSKLVSLVYEMNSSQSRESQATHTLYAVTEDSVVPEWSLLALPAHFARLQCVATSIRRWAFVALQR